jgi:hypothetical protein
MKYPFIIFFLFLGLLTHGNPPQVAISKSDENVERGKLPQIKHINQGRGAYCTTASILMALQTTTGLDLSSTDHLSELAGIRSVACGAGKLGNKVNGFCDILNIENKELEYNIQAIKGGKA